ncbi:metalloregulator ArsR/SmtB family transcription factor [Bacillus sp. JCM 19041]|uniref:ArsR/SmtB family transcription factor n=1 Tax=Bacillus sp. JCM 19041 TaxID=1460637 RepID=UPI0006CF3C25
MADFYRAIADSTRRQILYMTSKREYTQSELVNYFAVSQPAVKKHLDMLVHEELLAERKEGRYRFYRLNVDVYEREMNLVTNDLNRVLDHKLNRLKQYIEEEGENG